MKRIGFIINPVAGMGGSVALKGTDGMVEEAKRRGAIPVSPKRAEAFLRALKKKRAWYTCSGIMGEEACRRAGLDVEVVYEAPERTAAEDTKKAAACMAPMVDIIVFVGGDGTACDVLDAVDAQLPVLGVPAGVKMYSAVFSNTPADAAEIVNSLEELPVEEREVMDIDEEAFRKGEFRVKLKGYARTPVHPKIQAGKEVTIGNGKREIAEWVAEEMDDDRVYIIGGGSTTWEIKKYLGIEGSFLGIDVIKGKKLLRRDAGEREINKLLDDAAKIVVSPLGNQGFIFGRGNQPISHEIIERVGRENIIVVATREKLARIDSLKVDTGDERVNDMLRGYMEVITGYRERKLMKVE